MKADVESTTCVFAARPCRMEARDQRRSRTQVNPRQGWSGLGKRAFQREARCPIVAGTVMRAAVAGREETTPWKMDLHFYASMGIPGISSQPQTIVPRTGGALPVLPPFLQSHCFSKTSPKNLFINYGFQVVSRGTLYHLSYPSFLVLVLIDGAVA